MKRKYILPVTQVIASSAVMGTALYRNVFTKDGSAFLWAAFFSAFRTGVGGVVDWVTQYQKEDHPPSVAPLSSIRIERTATPTIARRVRFVDQINEERQSRSLMDSKSNER